MEFGQLHVLEPLSIDCLRAELRARLEGALLPHAMLGVSMSEAWRPADLWAGAEERLCCSVGFEIPDDALLTEAGTANVARGSIARRLAPVHPAEAIACRFPCALVAIHSDAARFAYVAVYRERQLRMSLMLQDGVRLVRCDGDAVIVQEPPRFFPELDRAGVLLAGVQSFLRTPIPLEREERMFLADQLGGLTDSEPIQWLVRNGRWGDEVEPPQRAFAR